MGGRIGSALLLAALSILLLVGDPSSGAAKRTRHQTAPAAQDDRTVLLLSGVIGPGSYREFRRALSQARPDLVILDSPGGILGEALFMGEEVRRRGLSTLIVENGQCASACAVVFLSGRTKYAGKGAALGLHAASDLDGHVDTKATSLMATYLRNVGVPKGILRRMAATAPSDMRWLTRAEQRSLRIEVYPNR